LKAGAARKAMPAGTAPENPLNRRAFWSPNSADMNLDDAQKKKVSGWIAEGLKLAEIQKRLGPELGLNLTYMEVRLLVDDLKLMPKDPLPPKVEKPLAAPPAATSAPPGVSQADAGDEDLAAEPLPAAGAGKVSVTVDSVARPGALVSGNVTFSDGQPAVWYLDQMGRLGLAPKQQGYKPSAADVQVFQQALEAELSKMGL